MQIEIEHPLHGGWVHFTARSHRPCTREGIIAEAKSYICLLYTSGEYKTSVSVTGLQDVLVGNDGAPISDEAEAVYRKICYYFTDEEFLLPEARLVALAEDA